MTDELNKKEYTVTSTRRIVELPLSDVEDLFGVDQVLAIYRVGDRVEVVTESK